MESPAPSSDELGSAASLLRELADAPGGDGLDRGPLAHDQIIAGKYRVLRTIGSGGMGVVYLARDVRLGRDVALKVGKARSASALARVEREAQALARVSHPNIVVVHEVGEVDGRVFVAMEHVAGTARAWLTAAPKPRTPREILALYAAAGDGLAAAHAAGIVHRDFKPDNVLVGDGRPRVADFGLARADEDRSRDDGGGDDDEVGGALPAEITRAGAVIGTVAYMPPEQLAGGTVDARADQFSFCVALWEALHGTRPFGGATPEQVKIAIESSPPGASAGRTRRAVPRHVDAALRRGLRADPAERWPSMAALVAELRRDPARRRRNLALAVGVIALAVGAAIAVPRLGRREPAVDPCAGGDARIAVAWNPAHANAVRAAFAALHLDTAGQASVAALDQYAQRWVAADRAVCEAAGSVSDHLRERATGCLDARRDDLADAADQLDSADYDTASRAGEIVTRLAPPERCTALALAADGPMPTAGTARTTSLCATARATATHPGDASVLPQGISLWDGDFQAHVIQRRGDEVWASYEHDTGLFYGRVEGDLLTGWWCETPHHYPGDNGKLEMKLVVSRNGSPTLDGRFLYGDRGDWHDDWDDAPAPWSTCSEQTAARLVAFDWRCPMPVPRPPAPPP